MKRYWTFKAAKVLVLVVGCVALVGAVVMLLWNALVPEIFGAAPITLVQALGLVLLARILAGGRGHAVFGGGRRWRERWRRKVATMSPEQKAQWRARCGDSLDAETTA